MIDEDRGSATVPAVALLGVLLLLGAALGAVAAVVVAHRAAQSAADLAALAAATALADGGDGCGAAASVADANDAELTRCALNGPEARVTVRVAGPRWRVLDVDPEAEARAGPG
ncbi:Rv3654c family TadE-like protein [Nocardioides sp. W7]|uniref:Rv3654c family TadE-like protein n=1 Tax=Nocardioides sp. W7 TaxID=2931390 RepID=UPI001FD01F64|nr:Rv3654c family TadE-like protein [Nocardioides sp. W7]